MRHSPGKKGLSRECRRSEGQPAVSVGLLLNFNVELLTRDGVKRIISAKYKPTAAAVDAATASEWREEA
jgi:hypothetical protein